MDIDNTPIRPNVLRALSQVPEVTKQVREEAREIARDARKLAPRRTGNLARNITVERVYDKSARTVSYIVGWGPKAWYGWLVEAGTEDTIARPHIVPAAIKHGAVAPRSV